MTKMSSVVLSSIFFGIFFCGCGFIDLQTGIKVTRDEEPAPVGPPTYTMETLADIANVAKTLKNDHIGRTISVSNFYVGMPRRYVRGVLVRVEGSEILVLQTDRGEIREGLDGAEEIWLE